MTVDRGPRLSAEDLRHEFDSGFAHPLEIGTRATEDLLQFRFARTAYALRLAEVSGLLADLHITPLPSGVPELIGICGVRGALLPVYDLGALLGYAPEPDPRWIAITSIGPVGLAVATFEGQVRVSHDALARDVSDGAMRHVQDAVRIGDEIRPVLSVPSLVQAIGLRVRAASQKEHGR